MSAAENKTIMAVFDVPGQTAEQYAQIIEALEAAGAGSPKGRMYHVATIKEGGMFVVDVWESTELLEQFAQTLMPITQKVGSPPAEPQIFDYLSILFGGLSRYVKYSNDCLTFFC